MSRQPKIRFLRPCAPFLVVLALAGCQVSDTPRETAAPTGGMLAEAPPGAPEGSCWAQDASPAVVETITEQVVVEPEVVNEAGEVIRPAIYRTETRQAIVRARQDTVFQVPCPDEMTLELIASLQRALQARNLYRGPTTGVMDGETRTAIRRYQKPLGLDSSMLSMSAAQALGLVALERGT